MTTAPPAAFETRTLAERIAALTPKQRALYERKRRSLSAQKTAEPGIPRREGPGPWPATVDQAALWFIQQLDPATSAYNIGNGFRLRGELDVALLERCFGEMALRHEALRTTFRAIDGQPYQMISPTFDARIEVTDVRGEDDPEAAALPVLARLIKAPFDLEKGPLVRLPLVRIADDDYVMVGVMHHTVTDWWSYHLFFNELLRLYEARRRGRPNPLPPIPVQFADWALWRERWLASEEFEKQSRYWQRKLRGVPLVLEVPGDRPRPPVQSARGAREPFAVPRAVTRAVRAMNHDANASSFMTLLAGLGVLLSRYTGQRDLLIGTPTSFDRESEETRYMMGYLLNTLVLRLDLEGDPSFRELLGRVRATCLEAFANKELPFRYLVEMLNPERDMSRMPVYQVEYLYVSAESPLAHEQRLFDFDMPDFEITGFGIDRKTSPVDLQITFTEAAQNFHLLIEYNTDIFEPATIRRFGDHLLRSLECLGSRPQVPVSRIPFLDEAERRQIVETWNEDRWPPAPAQPLHRFFEVQAARTPDAVAVLAPGRGSLTYGELDLRTSRLAARLRDLGAGPETRVGLATSRSLEMMVGLYGILKAGAAYVPLDPSYPAARLALMIEDAALAVLATETLLARALPTGEMPVVYLDRPLDLPNADAPLDPPPEAAAYVIYTSGSTGRPKGVAVSHRNAVSFCHWLIRFLRREETAVTLASTSLAFDISLVELVAPLAAGGTVVLVDNLLELPALPPVGLTMINTVPSAMSGLLAIGGVPATVRALLLGGEALGRPLVDRLHQRSRAERIVNLYGPTETTVYSLWRTMPRGEEGPVLVGRPVARNQAYAVDRRLEPVPVGVHGELAIGGAAVSRGYHRRPALTAERFVPDPFAGAPAGGRLYRTGDLVRLRDGGEVEFLGRFDQQVKVRGFRIELGEVETALAALPGVDAAAAAVREDAAGEKVLAAYLAAADGLRFDAAELRRRLAEGLPHYMVPSSFVRLDELPLLPNGKVNRKALPAAREVGVEAPYVAPRTEAERRLAAVWVEVLELPEVSVHANFFDLGGHSLRATQVVSRLRRSFGVDLPLRALFDSPTLAELAARLAAAGGEPGQLDAVTPVARGDDLPLSSSQQRLWFLDQLEGPSAAYNMAAALELEGRLDPAALARALGEIVRRHEVLRTTFPERGGEPRQRIAAPAPFVVPRVDLRPLGEAARRVEARRLATAESGRPFDLARGPLLRVTLVDTGAARSVLLITMHHIVSDGWSIGVFVDELSTLYDAFRRGAPSPLAELPVQYADYACWQRRRTTGERLAAQLDYWRRQLAGAPPVLELPGDRPRPEVRTHRGAFRQVHFAAELAAAWRQRVRETGTTLYIGSLAVFLTLLGRITDQRDLVVGSPIANRDRKEVEALIGFFVNTLVLRGDLSGNPRFRELLVRMRDVALDAFAHQDLPFEHLVEELQPRRDLSRHPLFQISFVVQNAPRREVRLPGIVLKTLTPESVATRFDLELDLWEDGAALEAVAIYDENLFDGTTVRRFLRHYETLLASAAAEPEGRLHDLAILPPAERHQLCHEWQGAPRPSMPDACLHELVARQARRSPDAVAVAWHGGARTFHELVSAAGRLSHRLRQRGVGPESVVALYLERSPELLAGVLAVLEAGAAYLPLERGFPRRRLATLLEDARAAAVLTREDLAGELPDAGVPVICLDSEAGAEPGPQNPPAGSADPANTAYVLYTSGSTGRPKGVAVSHRAAASYLTWAAAAYDVGRSPRGAPLCSSLGFDLSLTSLFTPLLAGRSVFLVSEDEPLERLAEFLRDETGGYALVKLTPSHLEVLGRGLADARTAAPELLILGGEALAAEALEPWRRASPATRVVNEYGPTEAVVGCTAYEVAPSDPASGPVPIGRPIGGARIHLADSRLRPVPPGSAGEILVGGPGLARGYLAQPRPSAASFVPDPFAAAPGGRLYRTGDLARHLRDGTLAYLGRRDDQLKIRGFRVEPGEIEAALARRPDVLAAVVLAPDRNRLAACVVPRPAQGSRQQERELPSLWRAFLAERFPEHMVPSAFVVLDELPLLASGKVDRQALARRARDGERSEPDESFVAARTATEETLAAIWSEVLGIRTIGVHDDFFRLGGHSLLATQVASRVRQSFRVEVPLRRLFVRTTVAALAEELDAATPGEAGPAVERTPRTGDLPLSFAQQRLWFLDQLEGLNPTYNMAAGLELRGRLDAAALGRSLAEIVRRHEVLRTRFPKVGGRAMQVVVPAGGFILPRIDLAGLDAAVRGAEIRRLAGEEALRPFDLAADPMLRGALLDASADSWVLLLTLHHIASDGWSIGILVNELTALYTAFAGGEPSPLAELDVQYADYAVWQRRRLAEKGLEAPLSYWRRHLAGAPAVLELPTDRPRPAAQTFRGGGELFEVGGELRCRLEVLGQERGTTLFMTLLAGFATVLGRLSGQDDVLVGSPVAGRTQKEVEPLIGFFVNTLVLRTDLSGGPAGPAFGELLRRVKKTALDAYSHQEVPFERLVEELGPERSLSHSTLFQVMLALQNVPAGKLRLPGLTLAPLRGEAKTSRFDLSLFLTEHEQGLGEQGLGEQGLGEQGLGEHSLGGHFEYNRDLFDPTTVSRLGRSFRILMAAAVADPEQPIRELPLLGEPERQMLLRDWNATRRHHPPGTVHELFAARATERGEALAVEAAGRRLTYGELQARAVRLARRLRRLGVGPETRVAVALERSPEMLVALLGVLAAGGAYVPLDPAWPDARLAAMLEDSGAAWIVTEEQLVARWAGHDARTVLVDRTADRGEEIGGAVAPQVDPANLAYVIYTSGSTGRPKGVQVSHAALANFLHAMRRAPGLAEDDVLVAVTTISFDIAALELFLPLLVGARVVLASREEAVDGRRLGELLGAVGATALQATPATWRLLLAADWQRDASLKVLCGGEALPRDLAAALGPRGRETWNLYGPTETTVWSAVSEVRPAERRDGVEPIGRPIDNTRLHVLDPLLAPVPVGVAGELLIGGKGVARGYLGQPALTAERFVPDRHTGPGERLYRTGDLARYRAGGVLEFLGRRDHQVKVRGFRIELGEIEAALAEHPAVAAAVAAVREDTPGDPRLTAYLVRAAAPSDAAGDAEQLAEWRQVWNAAYRQPAEVADPALDTRGWVSSTTGLPVPEAEMREWADAAAGRILRRRPQRLLEIGCGTGMLLFRLAPHLERYHGTDLSEDAVACLARRLGESPLPVTLERRPAHELDGLGTFDAVVLNSVVQYFPSAAYLQDVLERVLGLLSPGGFVFLGDLRSLPLLPAFHASAQLAQAADATPASELRRRLRQRTEQEEELVLDPSFFHALARRDPRIRRVDVELKRGRHHNEMTCFRYDVTLDLEGGEAARPSAEIAWREGETTLSSVRRLLDAGAPQSLLVTGVPNARLTAAGELARRLAAGEDTTAGALREALAALEAGVDPEDVHALAEGLPYDVHLTYAGDPSRFDARFHHREAPAASPSGLASKATKRPDAYANDPQHGKLARKVAPQLRAALRRKLPEYMVPSSFVLLDELPLTANGKVDRAALAREALPGSALDSGAVAPRNELELELAGIFEELLGVGPVGVGDDFFDLGGHSLLAVQLVDRIERRFGRDLPLAALFDAPTIDQLAARLRHDGESLPFSHLVILRQEGTRPPLFCVHPGGGNVLCYRDLARALGPEQPFYGLRAYGLEEGQQPLASIEEMARRYVETAGAAWPDGPLLLAGWSLGGFVAFEMARQLESAGREVALVALLDTFPHEAYPEPEKWRNADDAELYVKMLKDSSLSAEALRQLDPDEQLTRVVEEAARLGFVPPDMRTAEVRRYLDFFKTSLRMRFLPRPYGGRVTVLHVAEHDGADIAGLLAAWEKHAAGGVEAHLVPGEHETLVEPPHVAALAAKLGRCIERARAAPHNLEERGKRGNWEAVADGRRQD